jgi:Uma2 family endonuclease
VRLAWLIDPKSETTFVYSPDKEIELKTFNQVLVGGNVLNEFELTIRGIL